MEAEGKKKKNEITYLKIQFNVFEYRVFILSFLFFFSSHMP